jgi:DNA-binding LacI/PurR family transcriptional regulator
VVSNCLCPPIPLIVQSTYELGRVSAQLLFERMSKPQPPNRTLRLKAGLQVPNADRTPVSESLSVTAH